MLNAQRSAVIGPAIALTLAMASAVGCGANGTGKPDDANSKGTTGDTTQQSRAQQEVSQALSSQAGQAYLAAAQNGNGSGPICQTEQQAMEEAIKTLASSQGQGIDAVVTAIDAFAKCVTAQVPNLPGMPIPGTGSTCMATVQNGNVVQTGDCSNCTVTQNGGSVSVMCTGGTSTGNPNGTPGIPGSNPNVLIPTDPNGTGGTTIPTIPVPDPTNPNGMPSNPGTGTGTGAGPCMATMINGQLMQTGDCSHCVITPNGTSVSVSCQQYR